MKSRSLLGTFASSYITLLQDLLGPDAIVEKNERTGTMVRIWPGMRHIDIDLENRIIPTCGIRKTHPYVAAAENAWCLLGHDHVDWLKKHTSVWNEFVDGGGMLREAYGYRWQHAFGVDQLRTGVERLRLNPSDRRIWISSWDPRSDIEDRGQKTVPCPVGFTLQVMGGRLYSTYVLRSSDTFLGLPHDVMRHAMLMDAVAMTLDVPLGVFSVAIANSHLYDRHWGLAEHAMDMPRSEVVVPDMTLPGVDIPWIMEYADKYVNGAKQDSTCFNWPTWNPKAELVK